MPDSNTDEVKESLLARAVLAWRDDPSLGAEVFGDDAADPGEPGSPPVSACAPATTPLALASAVDSSGAPGAASTEGADACVAPDSPRSTSAAIELSVASAPAISERTLDSTDCAASSN